MQIYGLKNCDSCKKALKSLPVAQLIDVRQDGVDDNLLAAAYEKFGQALVNTRSTTWRGLDEDERARPALDLLRDYPTLMKRPLIKKGQNIYLGWGKDVQADLMP